MSLSAQQIAELHDLLWEVRAGTASPDELARLERMVCEDSEIRSFYVRYMHLCADLHWSLAGSDENSRRDAADPSEVPAIEPATSNIPFVLPIPLDATQPPGFPSSPLSPFPSFLLSYLVAAAVLGIAMLLGWAWKVPEYSQVAQNSTSTPASPNPVTPIEKMQWVGRVTGLFDCQWADPKTEAFDGAGVSVGRTYALSSGLMEITYDTGAKVILQGPVTYQVESKSSGYLSLGRVTARVERKGEGGRGKAEESGNQRSPSPLSPLPSPLFSVRTPTAIVTDLGTEFGVEYDKSGVTRSLVFRGSVTLQAASADGKAQGSAQVLRENQSARVETTGAITGGGNLTVALGPAVKAGDFVRNIPKKTITTFDLVDVVAGGDGFSGRRHRGIDPTNGRIVDKPPKNVPFIGDGQYHRIKELPFVDGVFVPRSGSNRVQIDSAGHTFAGFLNSSDQTGYYIWGGSPILCPGDPRKVIVTNWGNINYGSPGHGSLFLHANSGITFDLDAIRRANPDYDLIRFRTVAGNTETDFVLEGSPVYADIWVFVDGQVRCQRRRIGGRDGAFHISIPLGKNDRFLTLVGTDGGNDIFADWITFGDPRLELVAVDPNRPTDSPPKQRPEEKIHR